MQNILCYDLAPSHGAVVLIDSELSVMIIIAEMKNQKHIHNLHQASNNAALVVSPSANEILGILTTTDCLRAIVVAVKEDSLVGHRSVREFLKKYNGRKRLVTAPVHLSVWDAARLFCLNHVHRIPILQVDEFSRETDVLYLLSLRTVFSETVLNLVESNGRNSGKHTLAPHVKNRTLEEARIGTWEKVITVSNKAYCGKVIDLLLESKLSCVGVVDEEGRLAGSISKGDVMRLLSIHEHNYLDILTLPVKEVYSAPPTAQVHNTIYEAIKILMESDQQCLFVVDMVTEIPVAAIAFIDIMDYILNSSEIHHKMSVG
ncbi:unnamed protein product [Enterobius vermicularis]|uniref:CBS domain-containing protein n=1 Tax=Enterobius vermicularis TaxID=51028 RepID=A0A0N4VM21_ENTVE|nr:unnamed protein product [Enterobius vermicularis]